MTPRTEIVVSAATVAKALAIFFGVILVFLAGEALLSIALALVIVLGLDPPVAALERRGWGRGKAALVVFGAVVAIVFRARGVGRQAALGRRRGGAGLKLAVEQPWPRTG